VRRLRKGFEEESIACVRTGEGVAEHILFNVLKGRKEVERICVQY
jgi:hypothetical protein